MSDTTPRAWWLSRLAMAAGVAGAIALVLWTAITGAAMFTPGALNSVAKTQAPGSFVDLGGVSTHAQLGNRCSACHPVPWSGVTMADRCLVCHADVETQITGHNGVHGGLLAATGSQSCRGCHTEHKGPNGALTLLDLNFPHEKIGFSLVAHEPAGGTKLACADCHVRDISHFDQATCSDCHTKLNSTFMQPHLALFGQTCLPCHDGVDRYGASFDHNKLSFQLTGAHAGLACAKCHTNATSVDALKSAPKDCSSCHAEPAFHAGALGSESLQCASCHSTTAWTPADFNLSHDLFPLDHGSREQQATCKTCHQATVTTYTCFGCHRHTPQNVVDEHEGRSLSELTDCIRCHAGGRRGGG